MRLLKLERYNCVPCKMVENYLQDLGVEYEKINIEDNPEKAMEYGVMSVPVTLLLDDDGNEVDRVVGYAPPDLSSLVNRLD